jgi:hypothetical protein
MIVLFSAHPLTLCNSFSVFRKSIFRHHYVGLSERGKILRAAAVSRDREKIRVLTFNRTSQFLTPDVLDRV